MKHEDQAMAWMGVVIESQEQESSPEDRPAQKWVEGRNLTVEAKTKRVED